MMQNCLRMLLKRGQGPTDCNQVKEPINKPSGALGTCVEPRPATTSSLVPGTLSHEGGIRERGGNEEGRRPIGPLRRWVASLSGEPGTVGVGETGTRIKVAGRMSPWGGKVKKIVLEKERQDNFCKEVRSRTRAGNIKRKAQD